MPDAGKRVMIVEDDKDFVDIEKMILEEAGFEVFVAYSGKECIDNVRGFKPDLILLDIQMTTEYDGANTAQWLREQDDTKEIPIIVITSKPIYSIYPDEEWYPSDEFVNKPIRKDQLLASVRKMLKE